MFTLVVIAALMLAAVAPVRADLPPSEAAALCALHKYVPECDMCGDNQCGCTIVKCWSDGANTSVVTLDLSSRGLTSLPNALGSLSKLNDLDLTSNKLTSLPNSFASLYSLTSLKLGNNLFENLPNAMASLSLLIYLDVSNLPLAELSSYFFQHTQATEFSLILGDNPNLKTLPESFGTWQGLRVLYCYPNCALTTLPTSIGSSPVEHMWFDNLPSNFTLPESLASMTLLNSIKLADMGMTSVPEVLLRSKVAQFLLTGNQFTSVPADLVRVASTLKVLDLSDNQVADASVVASLTALGSLLINGNPLTSLPSLNNLTNLRTIEVANCRLTALPATGSLTLLRSIDASNNSITDLDVSLLPSSLVYLNLNVNSISTVPTSLASLASLTTVEFEFNPIYTISQEVIDAIATVDMSSTCLNCTLYTETDWAFYCDNIGMNCTF